MTKKRYKIPKAKDGELLVKYGHDGGEEDLFYCYPENNHEMRCDSKILMWAFERPMSLLDDKTLRQELGLRGYDITTLKFSIKKYPDEKVECPECRDFVSKKDLVKAPFGGVPWCQKCVDD